MDQEIIEEELPDSPRKFKIITFGAFLAGLFVLVLGLGLFVFKSRQSGDIKILSASSNIYPSSGSQIMVHVDGAIKNPGVYKLSDDARVNDAVAAAGGFTSEADGTKVNLAAKIKDGEKIYIQKVGESVSQNVGSSASQQTGQTASQLINVNTASLTELDKLPGIGPVTAQKIIDLRPYGQVSDLLTKKAVSSSVYNKIKDLVSL